MLFERTALSKKPDKLIRRELAALRAEDRLTPDLVFRDPCVPDFPVDKNSPRETTRTQTPPSRLPRPRRSGPATALPMTRHEIQSEV